jgi:hypothetical protein
MTSRAGAPSTAGDLMPDWYSRIREQYQTLQGDSTELFQTVLAASEEIGMDSALAALGQCVAEKRLRWLEAQAPQAAPAADPVREGYRWFYEKYLRVRAPADGEIVEQTERRIVMRWWNPCPTLDACLRLGLDTREVCKKAYEMPVREFLKRIHPKLRFDRNYERIRPHASYCEEIIELGG